MLKDAHVLTTGGNMAEPVRQQVHAVIKAFENKLELSTRSIPPRIIRAKLDGTVYALLDPIKLLVIYHPHPGMNQAVFNIYGEALNPTAVEKELRDWHDIQDLSSVSIPREALSDENHRDRLLDSAIAAYVETQMQKQQNELGIQSFNPIFGPNKYPVQRGLVFVLMPFNPEMDRLYAQIFKPAIEDDLRYVSRRADEITGVSSVMHDIWKSICESELILADVTSFNPNVMYELGMAHTVGKPSVIIHQQLKPNEKFPFDLHHIRRIIYTNDAAGGPELRRQLVRTLRSLAEERPIAS